MRGSDDKWKPTGRSCVFYREHPTRKNGVKKDRQFLLRYTIDGKTLKGVFGWESDGGSLAHAELKVQEFKNNAKAGVGPISLAQEQALIKCRLENEARREALEHRKNVTLDSYFYEEYLPVAKANKKPRTVGSEVALYEKWVGPVMGKKPIRELLPIDFERLKKTVVRGDRRINDAGEVFYVPKSARTVHYCVSIVIQIWNMAFDNRVVEIQPPRRKTLNLPMIDNQRTRAFSVEQARIYFDVMKNRSPQWHDVSLVSLYAGLRASEVLRLEVDHLDRQGRKLFLKSPKKQRSQTIVLNDTAYDVLKRLVTDHPTGKGLIFEGRRGEQITEVSNTVQRVIDELGFNDGVTDRRDRLTFHSWRHTYATWLLDGGTDIFTVSQLLRHSSLAMTRRYVHPHEDKLRSATKVLDKK